MRVTAASTPLSDDEYETLAELVEDFGAFEVEGLLGFLNAIAVAPHVAAPSAWLPIWIPDDPLQQLTKDTVTQLVGLVFPAVQRCVRRIRGGEIVAPLRSEEACELFAAGYAEGPRSTQPGWTTTTCGRSLRRSRTWGRRDLIAEAGLAELDADPTPKQQFAALHAFIGAAYDESRKLRISQPPPALRSVRVGRNEPCPCGSGKKYKRCCADAVSPAQPVVIRGNEAEVSSASPRVGRAAATQLVPVAVAERDVEPAAEGDGG